MPLTNAERQARFRQKKIEELGIDKYNETQRQRYHDYYYKDKPIIIKPAEPEIPEIVNLKPLGKKVKTVNKSELTDITIKNYTNTIKKIYKHYKKTDLPDDCDIIKCLNSEPYKTKNIKADFAFLLDNTTLEDVIITFNKNLKNIYCVFTRVQGFATVVKKLYPYIIKEREEYEAKRGQRQIPTDVLSAISFKKEDVIDNVNKAQLDDNIKLIAYLYLLIPTRRINDYRLTKISKTIPDNTFDNSFNYYFDNKIYIFNTKNKQVMTIDLPPEITSLINLDDEFMLGKLYIECNLTNLFKRIMMKIYKLQINITLMRILYATHLRNSKLSGYDWNKKAQIMGHSLKENIMYSAKEN
jgi:hypothetical protein